MKILILVFFIFSVNAIQAQFSVNSSVALDSTAFMADKDVKELMKKYKEFKFDVLFGKFNNEIILFMDSQNKRSSLFIMKWNDDKDLGVYHEVFEGGDLRLSNNIVQLDSSDTLNKNFYRLEENVEPSFIKQSSVKELKYYNTEFIIIKRTNKIPVWGLYALNGREFKNATGYPGLNYKNLIDYILVEFGGMP